MLNTPHCFLRPSLSYPHLPSEFGSLVLANNCPFHPCLSLRLRFPHLKSAPCAAVPVALYRVLALSCCGFYHASAVLWPRVQQLQSRLLLSILFFLAYSANISRAVDRYRIW